MRYLPKSPVDREEMLAEIGAASIDDLFSTIPAEYQLKRDLKVPRQHGESEILDRFRAYAESNAVGYASFLGAGVYRHYRPVIIDSLVQRGEFLTSYTPYQPGISQGTLQAMFEFQTMICELTGIEIANAEMAHAKGALLIVSIAEAVSLGIVKPPTEADIVSLEAQSYGVAVGYGGPYCGVIACKEKFLRQMPGRLIGETKDKDGKRGFVLTLSTREQHIRREKATSNICTN